MANWEKLIEEHYSKKKEVDTSLIIEMIDLELENTFQSGVIDGHAGKRLSTKGKKKAGGDPYDEDPPKARSKSAPAGFGVLEESEIDELFALGLLEEEDLLVEFSPEMLKQLYDKAAASGKDKWITLPRKNTLAGGSTTTWTDTDFAFPLADRFYYNINTKTTEGIAGTGDLNGPTVKFLEPDLVPVTRDNKTKTLTFEGENTFSYMKYKVNGEEKIATKNKASNFMKVQLTRAGETSNGYISINSILKPSGGTQSRVTAGSLAQDAVKDIVANIASKEGKSSSYVDSAPPGSTRPDLVMTFGGERIQFEIKGRKSEGGVISFFDKSARRGGDNSILDAATVAFVNNISVEYFPNGVGTEEKESANLGSAMSKTGFSTSEKDLFESSIDFFQKHVDPRIGFCGDPEPVPRSGALPPQYNVSGNKAILDVVRTKITGHLAEGGDDYFAVYTVPKKDAEVYYLPEAQAGNVLKSREFPELASGRLATYGGCSSGATRVAFKASLAAVGDGLPPEPDQIESEPEN